MDRYSALNCMFAPRSVAVIGATARAGSVGRTVIENLTKGSCRQSLYPVNPAHEEVLGLRCYKEVGSVPKKIDLAVVATPAPTVPEVIGQCVKADVRAAVVLSAGFKEQGAAGLDLEQQIRDRLKGSRMRLVGPNCLGIMNPITEVNATFAHDMALPGSVALLSQSGALETAILDWSLKQKVGFSAIVSTGSMLDVDWGDLIDYFGQDYRTRSIVLYLESIGNARSFLSAAREVAVRKPIIVIKAGRSEAAAHAASSHTGALTGSDEVFDAAVRRCGVLRVQSIADLFHMAETLGRQPRPRGPRLMIVTNAGGPGVLATDALVANGGELAPLSDSSRTSLNEFLASHWSHGNPIDVLGDADTQAYVRALGIATQDPGSDGVLAILAPQGMTDPTAVAEHIKLFAQSSEKPLLASWMGGDLVAKGIDILNEAGIPTFAYADSAARAFCYMWHYTYNLRGIYETPSLSETVNERNQSSGAAARIIENARRTGRTVLTEVESKEILEQYGIPVVKSRVAHSEEEAVTEAKSMTCPCVLKVYSDIITHKTDVGGVKLNLQNEQAVRQAFREIETSVREKVGGSAFQGVTVEPMISLEGYELILGSSVDPQFGPVVLFGSGGQLVEVYRDRALALPPLNATLARRLMEQTHVFAALNGVRGRKPVDLDLLERVLVRFSTMILEQPWIKEVDINPLLASPNGVMALDARLILHATETPPERLPQPAIRPYPTQYVRGWKTKVGKHLLIRPIRPEDEPLMVKFHESLSRASVYLRYFHMVGLDTRLAHIGLMQQCFIDYDREMALVAECKDDKTGETQIIGVARLTKDRVEGEAEVAVVVRDEHQGVGIGTELVRRLIEIGRDEKLRRIVARVLLENEAALCLVRKLNFETGIGYEGDGVVVFLDLVSPQHATIGEANQ